MQPLMGGMSAGMSWLASSPGSPHGEKDREVSSSSTVTQCHTVTRSHQTGKSRTIFVLPRGRMSSSPLGEHQSRAWVPCPLNNSSGAGDGPSKPVLTCGVSKQTFTFAEPLEWADLNFYVICFNHSVVTWIMSWGEVEKHQNLLVPHPHLVSASFPWLPSHSISSAGLLPSLQPEFGYKLIFIDIKPESMYSVLLFLSPL